ncbi:hypothetical protein [Variovorax paradoxus]|uniref:hypothetical protein n=1 Tax=Variovorax paradoxus TaxID=34073 RepID=UPI0019332637|nr:hypothetical protein INQ48_42795 [Variovorax paradoxus]
MASWGPVLLFRAEEHPGADSIVGSAVLIQERLWLFIAIAYLNSDSGLPKEGWVGSSAGGGPQHCRAQVSTAIDSQVLADVRLWLGRWTASVHKD